MFIILRSSSPFVDRLTLPSLHTPVLAKPRVWILWPARHEISGGIDREWQVSVSKYDGARAAILRSGSADNEGPFRGLGDATQFEMPQWYKDAKFGIFIHWGVFAVPGAMMNGIRGTCTDVGPGISEHLKRYGTGQVWIQGSGSAIQGREVGSCRLGATFQGGGSDM
jgi:hypothetical protein